jgi:hypothetical protein
MEIFIDYLLKKSDKWERVYFSPEDFFDLGEEEIPEVSNEMHLGSVPKYNETYEYLNFESCKNLKISITKISDDYNSMTINEVYYNNGNNTIVEVLVSGKNPYREIIIKSQLDDKKLEIIRIIGGNKNDETENVLMPTYHGILSDEERNEIDVSEFVNLFKRVLPDL